jgi:hypothetical protein
MQFRFDGREVLADVFNKHPHALRLQNRLRTYAHCYSMNLIGLYTQKIVCSYCIHNIQVSLFVDFKYIYIHTNKIDKSVSDLPM